MMSNSLLCKQFPKCFILVTCWQYTTPDGSIVYNKRSNKGRYDLDTVGKLTCHPGFSREPMGNGAQYCQFPGNWSPQYSCRASE